MNAAAADWVGSHVDSIDSHNEMGVKFSSQISLFFRIPCWGKPRCPWAATAHTLQLPLHYLSPCSAACRLRCSISCFALSYPQRWVRRAPIRSAVR